MKAPYEVPEGFLRQLPSASESELVVLLAALSTHPENEFYLAAVQQELRVRGASTLGRGARLAPPDQFYDCDPVRIPPPQGIETFIVEALNTSALVPLVKGGPELMEKVTAKIDEMGAEIRLHLLALVPAKLIGNMTVSYPADWWQALRLRWFPTWWLERWPVKLRFSTIDVKACIVNYWFPEHAPNLNFRYMVTRDGKPV